MAKTTPLMSQYQAIKSEYPDCLLFFRLGDFYEMFGEDAKKAAKELDIVLTSRGAGKDKKIPMCGVPYHAAENYLNRLLEKGYKIAVCEQLEEAGPGKGLVKRDVVRVVTPGTILNDAFLDQSTNNYILSLYHKQNYIGCAWSDISTGEFHIAQFSLATEKGQLLDLVNRLLPAECIYARGQSLFFQPMLEKCWGNKNMITTEMESEPSSGIIENQFGQENMIGLDRRSLGVGITAAANLLNYLQQTQKTEELPFQKLSVFIPDKYMYLDAMTTRNLELFTTLWEGKKEGSLFWALDHTMTAMGKRLLRNWLELPLQDVKAIQERQDAVEGLLTNLLVQQDLRASLDKVYDLERIISRVDWSVANPRDLVALADSLAVIPEIKDLLKQVKSNYLNTLAESLDPMEELRKLICSSIIANPPLNPKSGGVINDGYHPEVDKLRKVIDEGESWVKNLENEERIRTGIKSLKVGFNKVFGYYIEITKANMHLAPDDYIRKQTLTQCERFITPELKEQESLFLGATERVQDLEYHIFIDISNQIKKMSGRVRKNAHLVAQIDCLTSFSEAAISNNYVKPEVNAQGEIHIKNGRHPILDQLLSSGSFVPNDLQIGEEDNRIHILTGPNMAGKSTYMRQMATLVLMAQCGSFIPAEEAEIGVADRVFVRAGAMDDLGKGQSTFMMEMNEVSYIIHHATKNSFIVLDEIGRGTGTFDGLGIAWALVEYLHDRIIPRAIFATHYHQLTDLADKHKGVVNYSVAVAEKGSEIIFLHKVIPGGTDKSYGIQVASLANLPSSVVERAREVAAQLETGEQSIEGGKQTSSTPVQLTLFDDNNVILEELKKLNLIQVTPLEALNMLSQWQQRLLQTEDEPPLEKKDDIDQC